MTLTVASLCSGYEATGLGLTLAGWDHRLAFVADPDPAASKVLAHHHPDVPNLGDITRVAWGELGLTGEIDLLPDHGYWHQRLDVEMWRSEAIVLRDPTGAA